MTEKLIAIVLGCAIIAAFIGFKELIWLGKNQRFDINQAKEEIDDFYILRLMKKAAVIIAFSLTAVFLSIAFFLSN